MKELRVKGISTLEQANDYLASEFLPWCNAHLRVAPASSDDAHRPLEKGHDLAAILSHVEARRVANDYTFQLESKLYQIDRKDIRAGLRGAAVRVEKRRDGGLAVRFQDHYLALSECQPQPKAAPPEHAREKPVPRQVR